MVSFNKNYRYMQISLPKKGVMLHSNLPKFLGHCIVGQSVCQLILNLIKLQQELNMK